MERNLKRQTDKQKRPIMATYAISFRIADKGNDSERYKSFVDAVKSKNSHSSIWEETTSFILIKSDSMVNTLAFILAMSEIDDEQGDKFIVINTETNEAAHYGISYPNTFDSLFN